MLPELFGVVVDAYLPQGGIYTTSGHVAAAVWVAPSATVDEERLASDLGRVSGDDAERLYALLEAVEAHHPRVEHRYLFAIGTRPGWQGLGIGARMLQVGLDGCERDGLPAYLEASSERSGRLYERHGFEVTQTLALPDGPSIWCMWRPAVDPD